jgi:antirestriction protein ArdC
MTNDKTQAAIDQLEKGVAELIESDSWTDYLATQAKFHRYSPNNALLIMLQRPDATMVAGYRAWIKDHKRHVRKGEKGIRILAPCSVWKDPDDHDAGRKLIGFRVVSVFDIGQTDGEPLPEITEQLQGDAPAELHAQLVELITGQGFTYTDAPTGDASNGWTNFGDRRVNVDTGLSPAMRTKTTAHELAHVLLHDPADPDRPASRELVEVEAESVAYVVCHALGIDSGGYSLGYVAGWSGGDPDKVRAVAARVQRTASKILDTIDATHKIGA